MMSTATQIGRNSNHRCIQMHIDKAKKARTRKDKILRKINEKDKHPPPIQPGRLLPLLPLCSSGTIGGRVPPGPTPTVSSKPQHWLGARDGHVICILFAFV